MVMRRFGIGLGLLGLLPFLPLPTPISPRDPGVVDQGVREQGVAASRPATYVLPKKDAASIDGIVTALYDVISGEKGEARDWKRFRALFHPEAQMQPLASSKTGRSRVTGFRPLDYVKLSGPWLEKNGFHEQEIARRVEYWGHIASVFSTYEARHALDDAKPFMRGINMIQLVNDGKRWFVLNIVWQQESSLFQLPPKYLPKRKAGR